MKRILFLSIILLSITIDSEGNLVSQNFESKRISRTSIITLNAPLEKVFPLFGPIKEKEWADG